MKTQIKSELIFIRKPRRDNQFYYFFFSKPSKNTLNKISLVFFAKPSKNTFEKKFHLFYFYKTSKIPEKKYKSRPICPFRASVFSCEHIIFSRSAKIQLFVDANIKVLKTFNKVALFITIFLQKYEYCRNLHENKVFYNTFSVPISMLKSKFVHWIKMASKTKNSAHFLNN